MYPILRVVRRIFCLGSLVLPLLTVGCGGKNVPAKAEVPHFIVSCVAVLPAVSAVDSDSEHVSAIENIENIENRENIENIEKKELEHGRYFLDKSLQEYFISRDDIRLVSDGQLSNKKEYLDMQPLARAEAVADRLSCNAVLETTLHRYRERVGGQLTAKEPASVAFAYRLLAMPDGKVLCQDSFDAKQQSLMTNLLSLSSGTGGAFTWLSAEEFMMQGLRNRLNDCSYLVGNH